MVHFKSITVTASQEINTLHRLILMCVISKIKGLCSEVYYSLTDRKGDTFLESQV